MRTRALLREFLLILALLTAATALCAATGLDLALERRFFVIGAGWGLGEVNPWRFLYNYGVYPAYLLAGSGLVLFCLGLARGACPSLRRRGLFLILLIVLGPGLVVNTVFKEHWGRPRPRQMQVFGGDRQFHEIWERGTSGTGNSFPSGHASAAFYLMAPYFVLRARERGRARVALAAGVSYGLFMGFARMVQGGHFLSDVLWAGGVVYLVGLVLYYLLRLDEIDIVAAKEPAVP